MLCSIFVILARWYVFVSEVARALLPHVQATGTAYVRTYAAKALTELPVDESPATNWPELEQGVSESDQALQTIKRIQLILDSQRAGAGR
jgi:hypothetical protein